MKRILLFLILMGCNQPPGVQTLEKENLRLQKKVDSLKVELNKCDMLIESYEGMPMNI